MKKCPTRKNLFFKVMKVCSLQGLLAVMLVSISAAHPNYAQLLDKKVTLQLKDVPLESVLKAIEAQAGIKFFYSADHVKINEKITIDETDTPLRELLEKIFDPLKIKYTIHEKRGTVSLKTKAVESSPTKIPEGDGSLGTIHNVKVSVSGRVTDEQTGLPMAGVNVIVKGTVRGTSTDAEGLYVIDAEEGDLLVFSFIGFKTLEIRGANTIIDVVMEADLKTLEAVEINAGYWTVSEQERTGSISRVTAKEIANQPVSNPLAALQANVPGLQVIQPSGVPGANLKVRIRGVNSISNGNEPLYIVDGVPFTSNSLALPSTSSLLYGNGPGLGTGPLNGLNPADIESIEVLKDADATAIYGSRGSNGVILITTKKGAKGKTNVDFNFYTGIGLVASKATLLGTQQYIQMRKEAYGNDNVPIAGVPANDLLKWDTTRYTDWQEELIGGTSTTTDGQLSISGGDSQTQFIINGGYHRETTVFPGDYSDQRVSTHFNLTHRSPDQKLGALVSFNYAVGITDLLKQDLTGTAMSLSPNAPALYNDDGELNWENSTWVNPLSYLNRTYEATTNTLIGNSVLSYLVLPGLEIKTSLGYTNIDVDAITATPVSSYNPAQATSVQNETAFGSSNFRNWIIEPQLSWRKKVLQGNLTAMVGSTFMDQRTSGVAQIGRGFSSEALMKNLIAAPTITIASNQYAQYRYTALFGRINYVLADKYILNVTGRRDGSSRFGPGTQFANFGAIGVAWIFSKEGFLNSASPALSFGKIRASYGVTGNDQLADYAYLDTYASSSGPYNGKVGLAPVRLSNPDFGWETNKKAEASIDLGFANDRIMLSGSYYRNRSTNQLVGFPLPPTTGFSNVQGNFPATVQNSGIEVVVSTVNIDAEEFKWTTSINISLPRNKLVDFPNLELFPEYSNTYVVGEPLGVRKLFFYTGLDATTGLYTFEDVNEDGSLTQADRQSVKFVGVDYHGGLQNSISYKGFEFSFLFQFVKQTGNNYLYAGWPAPGLVSNQLELVMNRWTSAGSDTDIQRFTRSTSSPYQYARNSDLCVSDASFVRLKNIALSYSIPDNWLKKLHAQKLRIFVSGQNLFTITGYDGLDPETQLSTLLPPLKVLTGGINVTF